MLIIQLSFTKCLRAFSNIIDYPTENNHQMVFQTPSKESWIEKTFLLDTGMLNIK